MRKDHFTTRSRKFMKLNATAQNPLEWLALKSGLAPEPVAVGHFGYLVSKFLLEAIHKNVFENIGHESCSLQSIASACKLNETALQKLLGLLASMGLVDYKNNLFLLTKKAKQWLLKDSPSSMYWLLMFDQKVCFNWMDYVGEFLETGKGLQYHSTFTEEQWFYYQKAMHAIAQNAAREIVRKVPVMDNPTSMLDIGGSHGLYANAFCKMHPSLKATVLDLPEAIAQVQQMEHTLSNANQLEYIVGNILTDEIGVGTYDFILLASVAHHFTDAENRMVAQKVYAALKPGGLYTIMEVLSPKKIKKDADMLGTLGDIFFSLSSTSGTWSLPQIKSWMKDAGLTFTKKSSFMFIPGYMAITGKKDG